jgi:hypothetical protein
MDLRFLVIGAIMIVVGLTITILFWNIANTSSIENYIQNRMVASIGGVISAIGMILLIVSFGLYKRQRRFR